MTDLGFQLCCKLLNLLAQSGDTFPADDFGVDDASNLSHGMVEVVVHDHVFILLDRTQFLQCRI